MRAASRGRHLRGAGVNAHEASEAYERRMAELRAANVGPLDLFTDPVLDALDAAMRTAEDAE